MAVAPEKPRIYEGSRIPSPIPTVLQIPPDRRGSEDLLQVNFGPNHPSTHGVLRLIVDLHGEDVVGLSAVVGYLHTGFEKNMEAKTWWRASNRGRQPSSHSMPTSLPGVSPTPPTTLKSYTTDDRTTSD